MSCRATTEQQVGVALSALGTTSHPIGSCTPTLRRRFGFPIPHPTSSPLVTPSQMTMHARRRRGVIEDANLALNAQTQGYHDRAVILLNLITLIMDKFGSAETNMSSSIESRTSFHKTFQ